MNLNFKRERERERERVKLVKSINKMLNIQKEYNIFKKNIYLLNFLALIKKFTS